MLGLIYTDTTFTIREFTVKKDLGWKGWAFVLLVSLAAGVALVVTRWDWGELSSVWLSDAIEGDHPTTVAMLIRIFPGTIETADPRAGRSGMTAVTPLQHAAACGSARIAALLLDAGAKVNSQSDDGRTPLHYAASMEVAKLLLDRGANPNAADHNQSLPIQQAVAHGRNQVVEMLINKGAKFDATSLLFNALTMYGPTLRLPDRSGLPAATAKLMGEVEQSNEGLTEIVKLALNKGAKANYQTEFGETMLHMAVLTGQQEVVKLLLDNGAKINARANSQEYEPAGLAAPIRYDGVTPLHQAANKGFTAVARLLLEKGAIVNAKDSGGNTPLHLAIRAGKPGVVAILKAHGAR